MWIVIVIVIILAVVFLAKKMNNYVLIARNTTFIYEILKRDFQDCFADEESLLATSAAIDALVYVQKGQLTIDEIKNGVLCAKTGHCSLGIGYQAELYDNATEYLTNDGQLTFLWFIMQLEAMIFIADSNTSPDLILDAVKSKKKLIAKTIEAAQRKTKTSGISQIKIKQVHGFMSHNSFAGLRVELGIKDLVNTMSPARVVQSIPSVWFRVPLCIFIGYYDNKTTADSEVDYEALAFAMKGTDAQVYGRDLEKLHKEPPFTLASELFAKMKAGTEKEKLEDAVLCLLMGELINGGTNISSQLATKSADLGFASISKPIIGKLCEAGYPPSEATITEISEYGMKAVNGLE